MNYAIRKLTRFGLILPDDRVFTICTRGGYRHILVAITFGGHECSQKPTCTKTLMPPTASHIYGSGVSSRLCVYNELLMNGLDLETVSDDFLIFCWSNLPPRDRAKVMAGYPRTLWLFGAGASHHYNLNARGVPVPLANGFFEAFHNLPTSQGFHAHIGPFISYLGHYRGVQAQDVSRWRENIEDFMTYIEAEISELRAKKAEGDLNADDFSKGLSAALVFNNLGFILASVVNEAQNGPSDWLYRYLLEFCGPNDAFITFNWDTILDRALIDTGGWNPNDG